MSTPEICSGSFGEPGERRGPATLLPTARCQVCANWVEINPTNPGPDPYDPAAWRLEAHEPTRGTTIRLGHDGNPAADALVVRHCEKCGGEWTVSLENVAPDLVATCSACGRTWVTGHANG
jgi:hypothetical protein